MNTPQDVANKIVELVRPSKIAEKLKISPAELVPILAQAVVLGYIRRSDILFTFPKALRDSVASYLDKGATPAKICNLVWHLREHLGFGEDADEHEMSLLCELTSQRVVYSDLYEMLSTIEMTLHKRIRQCLKEAFLKTGDAWWREGVPSAVRKSCATKKRRGRHPFRRSIHLHHAN